MINIQAIENVGDCKPLYLPHSLYLKPLAKIHITVSLPPIKSGKSISNLELMDKLSAQLKPDKFLVLKVSKSTINFIRFEAEIDERKQLRVVIKRLDGSGLRLSNFNETFRVRCVEAKDDFPTRHDWDSHFRDAPNMDEMKAGERPDTIHLTHLPIRWFCPRHSEHEEHAKPSESIFKRIFEKFGRVTSVDIPICDPYRKNMSADISGMRTFSFEQDVLFEAYVQFEEYQSFVRAMDEFRGTKLVRKFLDKNQAINICVTFDKEKHMSDINALRRERTRKRLIAKARAEDEEFKRKIRQEAEQLELERQKEELTKSDELEKQRQREEKRKEKHLKKMQQRGQVEISQKIRTEERKLLIAQRKLESIRILEQVFKRIQVKQATTQAESNRIDDSKDLERGRLVEKYKTATEKLVCDQRKIVEDIKKKTPLMGLLKTKLQKIPLECSSDDEATVFVNNMHKNSNGENSLHPAVGPAPCNDQMLNPFKAVAALAVNTVPSSSAAYSAEAASEWMKSLSIFGYGVPGIFPGALYRPHPPFATSSSYRGFSRSRGRARMRGRVGRGGADGYSSSYYNPKHYGNRNDEIEDKDSYYHRNHSKNRTRSSSYSRSRSRSRGRRRSHSRSRSRSYYRKSSYSSRSRRSRSQCRSRSRSYSKSSTHHINNRKLASTRRSRSSSYSQSRSRSQSYTYSRRSKSRCKHAGTHSRSRSNSKSSNRVVLETDDLVRSAEQIQRAVAIHTKDRMREEERKIIKNFSNHQKHLSKYDSHVGAIPQSQENDLKMKDLTAENNLKVDHNSNRNVRHQSLPS